MLQRVCVYLALIFFIGPRCLRLGSNAVRSLSWPSRPQPCLSLHEMLAASSSHDDGTSVDGVKSESFIVEILCDGRMRYVRVGNER